MKAIKMTWLLEQRALNLEHVVLSYEFISQWYFCHEKQSKMIKKPNWIKMIQNDSKWFKTSKMTTIFEEK